MTVVSTLVRATGSHTTTLNFVSNEDLQVLPGATIIPTNVADDGISDAGGSASSNSSMEVDGLVSGSAAIHLLRADADDIIRIGPTGSVLGNSFGVDFDTPNTTSVTDDLLENFGYISAGIAVQIQGAANTVQNYGTMAGEIVIGQGQFNRIFNALGGVLAATASAITADSADDYIENSGTIQGGNPNVPLLNFLGADSTVVNTGDIEGVDDVVNFAARFSNVENGGSIKASQNRAITVRNVGAIIRNSGDISANDDTIFLFALNSFQVINNTGGLIEASF